MKNDLDGLMDSAGIDAVLVTGPGSHNPAMVYMTGGGHLTSADVIKKRGERALLFHAAMERDEAARTGLLTRGYWEYPYKDLIQQANGDPVQAAALRYARMLADAGVTEGRVALYGRADLSGAYPVFAALQQYLPGITLGGDVTGEVLGAAMMTKDSAELERMRRMGKITTEVVGLVADFLSSQPVRGDVLIGKDSEPLTIGRVKGLINLWLSERGAENPEGTIFAIGRDAGVPHSSGQAGDVLRLGQSIVFDIFPCEAGGGYYYDFTRTWCLGYAPDEVQQAYEQVFTVYNTLIGELQLGKRFYEAQRRTCDMFEAMGHPTIQTNIDTQEGYVHSVGHGLGLKVHERPFSGSAARPDDVLVPGVVVTIEPGLYYPERGFGVRLEDTVTLHEDGRVEILAEYPLDLVLPVKQ